MARVVGSLAVVVMAAKTVMGLTTLERTIWTFYWETTPTRTPLEVLREAAARRVAQNTKLALLDPLPSM